MPELSGTAYVSTPARNKRLYGWKDYVLVALLILGAFILYNTPKFISSFIQVAILIMYYRSSKSYYWIAVYMFIAFTPGGLYHNMAPEILSIVSSPLFGTVTFGIGFTLVTVLKFIARNRPVYFKNYTVIFFIYMLILVLIFGGRIQYLMRGFLSYTWLYLLPMILVTEDDFYYLFRLIFLFNVVVFLMNIYQIITGTPFVHFLSSGFTTGSDYLYLYKQYDVGELVRTAYGVQFGFLSMAGALFYLSYSKPHFPQTYLYVFLVLGVTNIVFSATRGWMLGSFFILFGYSMFLVPRLFRNLMVSVPSIVLIILILMQVSIVNKQLAKSWERFSTTGAILEGDLSAGGTSARMERGKVVLSKYRESPLLGFGFGDVSDKFADGHTGNQTMLLQFGAIGYGLYILFWISFMITPVLMLRRQPLRSDYRRLVFLPAFLLSGLIIIHSTSAMFLHPFAIGIFGALIFALGNYIYQQARIITSNKNPV